METYLVGGAVRDRLLSLPVTERDFVVVGATENDMLTRSFRAVGRDFPVYLHPDTGEEYALARTERKTGEGHTGFVCKTEDVTLEDDLMRRDLTINAIAESSEGELIDPWGGINDLEHRILRHVSDAFAEDPLRVLRVARFAAKLNSLGFNIHPGTLALMKKMVQRGEVNELTPERIYQEWDKAMQTGSPDVFFEVLENIEASGVLWPEITQEIRISFATVAADLPVGTTRTARLLMLLDEREREALATRLRMPNVVLRLANAGNRALGRWRLCAGNSADSAVDLLYEMDAYRNANWFAQLNEFLSVITAESTAASFWSSLAELTAPISAKDVSRDLKGPAIGDAIRAERNAATSVYLSASRSTAR